MINRDNNGELPFVFTRSGKWWGSNPKIKSQEEIDLVFSSSDNKNIIFAECKWRNDIKDVSLLKSLMEKATLFSGYENKYYHLFSKVDFSKECQAFTNNMENVKLNSLSCLFE